MNLQFIKISIIISILFAFSQHVAVANDDLNDGIPFDDSIAEADSLKKSGVNTNFYIMKAKKHYKRYIRDMNDVPSFADSNGMGNVVIGPGARIRGDVINIFQGDRNQNIMLNRGFGNKRQ